MYNKWSVVSLLAVDVYTAMHPVWPVWVAQWINTGLLSYDELWLLIWTLVLPYLGGFACVLQNLWQAIMPRLKKIIGVFGRNVTGWGITDDWHLWCACRSMLKLPLWCWPGCVEQASCNRAGHGAGQSVECMLCLSRPGRCWEAGFWGMSHTRRPQRT